jgi:uncharacterized protein (DUF736 family)
MPMIGTFTPAKDGGRTGSIHALTINAKLRFVPNDNRDNERAPVFRLFVGHFCIGNEWEARSRGESPKNYLRVNVSANLAWVPLPPRLAFSMHRLGIVCAVARLACHLSDSTQVSNAS